MNINIESKTEPKCSQRTDEKLRQSCGQYLSAFCCCHRFSQWLSFGQPFGCNLRSDQCSEVKDQFVGRRKVPFVDVSDLYHKVGITRLQVFEHHFVSANAIQLYLDNNGIDSMLVENSLIEPAQRQ